MPENFTVKSHLGEYTVDFVDDPKEQLEQEFSEEHILMIDRRVRELHGTRLGLTGSARVIDFEAKEENKRLSEVPALVERVLTTGISKRTRMIVVGGGITQDMGSFAASMLFRGLKWSFYPTTLLAQADSCIGSKTSINVGEFKNQVGNFYPPARVVISPMFLETLSPGDIKSGYGEMIKVHALAGEASWRRMEKDYESSFVDSGLRQSLIERSLQIKKPLVEIDEFDVGPRNVLNYGHTFGHALESASHYQVPHGQAVTVGMDLANFISYKRGLISEEMFLRIRALLRKNFPEERAFQELVPKFLEALRTDKKNVDGKLAAILTRGPGRMEKIKLPFDDILEREIKDYFSQN